jgi:hypothetical protein
MLLLTISSPSSGQFPWQKPLKRDPAEIQRIVGPIEKREPSRDLFIVWVWGIDKLHEKETHEYDASASGPARHGRFLHVFPEEGVMGESRSGRFL